MLYVMTNPHVHKKLQAEIDSTVYFDPVTSDAQARKLPYLQAVLKEGARIFSVAIGIMSKVVPPEGDTINGIFIPAARKSVTTTGLSSATSESMVKIACYSARSGGWRQTASSRTRWRGA
jgi:hypothetical protein